VRHILEPGGRGGVYQYTLGYALEEADAGRSVVIHTARDPELIIEHPNIRFCHCMRWQRRGTGIIRKSISLGWVLLALLPHLLSVARPADSWEVQGSFGGVAYLPCIAVMRLRGVRPYFAPHNDFSRRGSRLQERVRRLAEHLAGPVVVFRDNANVGRRDKLQLVRRSLTMYVPSEWPEHSAHWRARWGVSPVLLFAGQLRKDKDPVTLVRAAAMLDKPHVLAFVGEDLGVKTEIEQAANEAGLEVDIVSEYLELPMFAAAIASARVVVCPYLIASQSGVLALATSLGTPSIASRVGGLADQADETFEPGNAKELSEKLARLLN
jgi:glycosyltransferase involved in cell wall biosynthesis